MPQVTGHLGLEKRLKEHSFMQLWFSVCGPQLKECSRPLYMDYQNNLVIAAKDASVAQEISLMRSKFLSELGRMARSLGLEIKGIRVDLKHFHQNENQFVAPEAEPELPEPNSDQLAAVILSEKDYELLKKVSAEINQQVTAATALQNSINERVLEMMEKQLRMQAWRRNNGYLTCQGCHLLTPRLHALKGRNLCFNCFMEKADWSG
ncbi:MAG: DUF721 domain-containing protein [Candidatus Obscuribacterales bacterium]|nr:DUF721 domain-containing protein [Candidatus Obscuribacterales bacterium]